MASTRVLIVEDDPEVADLVRDALNIEGWSASRAETLAEAKKQIQGESFDVVLLDLTLPDGSGLDLLEILRSDPSAPAAIVLTGDTSLETAVDAVRRGAFDYVAKPFDADELTNRIRNAADLSKARAERDLASRKRQLDASSAFLQLPSRAMQDIYTRIQRVAPHDNMTVLVRGETGVGKEVIAQAVHARSPRSGAPFVAVNCANFERTLLQSELFGHEKGAFTGATERRKGLFELAGAGTLFLDEVGEMPMEVQAAFLRVLETRKFRRLGGSAELETNARILAATNRDLKRASEEGRFRDDLYYRLNTIELPIPPLRERSEDVRALAEHFCQVTCRSLGIEAALSPAALEAMSAYAWPGNIRELKNVVDRSLVVYGGGTIGPEMLRLEMSGKAPPPQPSAFQQPAAEVPAGGYQPLEEMERQYIRQVVASCGGNKTQAAEILGIARNTLLRKFNESDA